MIYCSRMIPHSTAMLILILITSVSCSGGPKSKYSGPQKLYTYELGHHSAIFGCYLDINDDNVIKYLIFSSLTKDELGAGEVNRGKLRRVSEGHYEIIFPSSQWPHILEFTKKQILYSWPMDDGEFITEIMTPIPPDIAHFRKLWEERSGVKLELPKYSGPKKLYYYALSRAPAILGGYLEISGNDVIEYEFIQFLRESELSASNIKQGKRGKIEYVSERKYKIVFPNDDDEVPFFLEIKGDQVFLSIVTDSGTVQETVIKSHPPDIAQYRKRWEEINHEKLELP